jgi:hypothetical protein
VPAIPAPPVLPAAAASSAPVRGVLGPIPGGTIEPSSPSKLGIVPLGAQTALLGSLGATAGPAPDPAPASPPGLLGAGGSDDAAKLASVNWHDSPVPVVKAAISQAETVQTPPVAAEVTGASAPSVETDPAGARSSPHPASVVALGGRSRGDQASGGDMLGAWGWGTDSHGALDDEYEDHGRTSRKRLVLAIGGGVAAMLSAVIVATSGKGPPNCDSGFLAVAKMPAIHCRASSASGLIKMVNRSSTSLRNSDNSSGVRLVTRAAISARSDSTCSGL